MPLRQRQGGPAASLRRLPRLPSTLGPLWSRDEVHQSGRTRSRRSPRVAESQLSAHEADARGRPPFQWRIGMFYVACFRKRAKVLYFDGTGLCVLHKRLSKGRFAPLWRNSQGSELKLSLTELQLFLEGSELVGRMPLSPAPLLRSELRRSSSVNELN